MPCLTHWSWCSLFWCSTVHRLYDHGSWQLLYAQRSVTGLGNICHSHTVFESYTPDDFYILFAVTELNFTLHDTQVQRCIKEVVRAHTHCTVAQSQSWSFLPNPCWCCSWPRSSWEHVDCGLTSTCTQVRITGQDDDVPLEHLPLSLKCNVNSFECITLPCFLLLCVWHAAYVSWWDIKWVCLRSYKYMGLWMEAAKLPRTVLI